MPGSELRTKYCEAMKWTQTRSGVYTSDGKGGLSLLQNPYPCKEEMKYVVKKHQEKLAAEEWAAAEAKASAEKKAAALAKADSEAKAAAEESIARAKAALAMVAAEAKAKAEAKAAAEDKAAAEAKRKFDRVILSIEIFGTSKKVSVLKSFLGKSANC
jgi:hypothetical protein